MRWKLFGVFCLESKEWHLFFKWKENGEKESDLKKNLKFEKGFGEDDLLENDLRVMWFKLWKKDPDSLIFYSTTYLSQEHLGASLLS